MKKIMFSMCFIFASISLFGADVYVGGVMTTDGFDKVPVYWKNGTMKRFFPVGATEESYDYVCMTVEGTNIYVCLTDGSGTYIYNGPTLLYQIKGSAKRGRTKMLALNGVVYLCRNNSLFRNGKYVADCAGDIVACNGFLCYDLYSSGKSSFHQYSSSEQEYYLYKGYFLGGTEYNYDGSYPYLYIDKEKDYRGRAMKVCNNNIYTAVFWYHNSHYMILKNNKVIVDDYGYWSFIDYTVLPNDKILYIRTFDDGYNNGRCYVDHPGGRVSAAKFTKIESLVDNNQTICTCVLGEENDGSTKKHIYSYFERDKYDRGTTWPNTQLPQCLEAYDLILK